MKVLARRALAALAIATLVMGVAPVAGAKSLKPLPNEQDTLDACEKSVCDIILKREAKGPPPSCNITKTWAKDTIKQGESNSVSWGFGDARCTAKIEIGRETILKALTADRHTIQSPTQTVKCQIVQDGELKPIVAKASPKLKFRKGKADKVWINLEKIEGPDNVTGTISTIAAMEDKLGIFHSSLIKSINKFIHKRCAQKYGPDAEKKVAEKNKKDAKEKSEKPASKAKEPASAAAEKSKP